MKKRAFLICVGIILLALPSCAAASSPGNAASRTGGQTPASSDSSNQLSKVASDITFREGTEKDGTVLLSGSDLTGFRTKYTEYNGYEIVFFLTESAKKSFAEATTKLSESGGTVSLWDGKQLLRSLSVMAPITEGNVAMPVKDKDSLESLCEKLRGSPQTSSENP